MSVTIKAAAPGDASMPSPFPGMNPYLEQDDAWHDFHEKIIPAISERLVPQVRPKYIVKIDEQVYVHDLAGESPRYLGRPDAFVAESGADLAMARSGVGLLAAPFEVQLPAIDLERMSYIEIRDRMSRQLVTAIEVLSPTNKHPGSGRDLYIAKRQYLQDSGVHVVEIDLIRAGKPMPMEPRRPCDYSVLVSRAEEWPRAGFWGIGLRERLPIIPVPLKSPDGDAQLDLQELLHDVYDASGYEDYIYGGTPDLPLAPDDQAWARSLVSQRRA
jgi:hypothetical protein